MPKLGSLRGVKGAAGKVVKATKTAAKRNPTMKRKVADVVEGRSLISKGFATKIPIGKGSLNSRISKQTLAVEQKKIQKNIAKTAREGKAKPFKFNG
jgi:hypothetical protein